jgi:membrane associated rhomboid family serine protease
MNLGRSLIALGLLVAVLGALISIGEKLPIRLGRLPGDIFIRGKHSVFYFPLATCLLVSIVLSLVMWLINRR